MPRPRLRLRLAALAAAVCLGGCGPSPGPTQPDVPVIDTAQMRGVARDQVEKAYADAAAHPEDIVSVAELALVLHAYGYYPAAEIAYRRALALRPDDARLRYLHAFVLQTLGDYDGATEQYRSMTGDAQFGARGWARIADLRLDAGDWTGARQAADRGLAVAPSDPELRYLRGRALLELGDAADARDEFDALLAAGVRLPDVYYAASRAARALGDGDAAAAHAASFERVRPSGQGWPDLLLGAVADKRQTARSIVERSQRKMMAGGDVNEAVRELERALEIDPEAYEAHIALVGLYGSMGEFSQVDAHFEEAMRLAPNTAQLHFNLGTARVEQGRYDEAAAAFRRTIELAPSHALAHAILGRIRYVQQDVDEANALFEEAVRLAPTDPTVRRIVLPVLLEEKDHARALELLEVPESDPGAEAQRQLWRAQALSLAGDPGAAREALALARRQLGEAPNADLQRQLDAQSANLARQDD
jgi:Tfp pilus assembly protein PilF